MDEGKTSATDKAARFGTTNERGRFAFGYKMHVAVDAGSGLVRDMKLTPANVQDVEVAPQLLDHADGVVYANRGYDSDGLRAELARRQLGDGLMRRRRGRPLTAAEVLRNQNGPQTPYARHNRLPCKGLQDEETLRPNALSAAAETFGFPAAGFICLNNDPRRPNKCARDAGD